MKKRIRRASRHVARWTWYAGAAVLLLLAVAFTSARVLLPHLADRKDQIESAINRVSPHAVRIEKLSTYWDGLHPGLQVQGLQVLGHDRKTVVMRLEEVRISLAWWPLLWNEYVIHNLEIFRPSLVLERMSDGGFRLAGFDPVHPTDEVQGESFLRWLFRQNRLAIVDGNIEWRDRRAPGPSLHLSKANLTLRNSGERHRLGASAVFPPALCHECSLVLDITGNPLASTDWKGDIYLRAGGLNVSALPPIARERLPATLDGRFDVRLWSRWEGAQPQRVEGQVMVTSLVLPLKGLSSPLTLRELGGDVEWRVDGQGWRLDLAKLAIGLRQPAWAADSLRVTYAPGGSSIEVGHVDLADLTAFAESMRMQHELMQQWADLRPTGTLDKLALEVTGDWRTPSDFTFKANLNEVGVQPRQRAFAMRGLSGHLTTTRDSGEFSANAEEVAMTLPDVFRAPLEARELRGRLTWQRRTNDWEFTGERLRFSASDGQANGDFLLRVPHDAGLSPTLKLDADFKDLNGAYAARYYPVKHLSRATLAWMEQAFIGGRVTKGHLLYDGPTREFPFANGKGRFEIRGRVRDGVYRFLPGWEPVRAADVEVTVERDQVRVAGQGRLGKLPAKNVLVQTQRDADGRDVVHVHGEAAGPVDDALRVLQAVHPNAAAAAWTRYLPEGLRGDGDGALTLDIVVPFDDTPVRVDGAYRFRNAGLRESATGASAEKLDGQLRFDEHGVHTGQVRGRFLGGEALLTAVQEQGTLVLHGQGQVTADGLRVLLGPRWSPHVSGTTDWRATWRTRKGAGDFQAELGLRTLKTRLPAPLDFPDGLPVEKLTLKTETVTGDNHVMQLSAGSHVAGRLLFLRQDKIWSFAGGRVNLGDTQRRITASGGRGLHVSAQLDAIDLDPWFPLLGQEGRGPPAWLSRISADIRALEIFDRPFGRVTLDLAREKNGWNGSLTGAVATGRVRYARPGAQTRIDLDLTTLNLPERLRAEGDTDVDPRRLPVLTVKAKSFQYRDKPLGELDFAAQPATAGWRVTRLNVTRPETQFAASGDWRFDEAGHKSEMDVRITSKDIGKTLEAFGIPDQMRGGDVEAVSHLQWDGSPATLGVANLSGRAEITAENGRFLQLKQGAGRFFGLLDLSAIGRYLTLDFSPIFGQGFVFDRIHAQTTLERGNVYTDDLSIRGPSAKMNVAGRIGLAAEDFDLSLEVQPQLTDSLTLGSLAVFGPGVAAAVLAFQQIFKKEITENTRVKYTVKGAWDNPTVTRTIEDGKAPAKPRG